MIGMNKFFELPEVKANQEIQKSNRYGSCNHRNAHIAILCIAEKYNVLENFETLADYDEA